MNLKSKFSLQNNATDWMASMTIKKWSFIGWRHGHWLMWRHRTEYIHGMSADASNLLYFNSLFSFHPRATFFKPGPNQNRSGVVRTSLRWIIFGLDSFHYLLLIFNQYASEPIKYHYLEIVIMIGRLKFFSVLIGLFGTIAANEFDEKTKQMLDWQ